MPTKVIADGVWPSLSSAARKSRNPAYAAVAYFGQGASKLLPLPSKSRLIVDASERTIKAGLTCPADLKRLQKRGVRIYSAENLHAKIYVFDKRAFVGSANVSNRSARTLIEAMVHTNEPSVVRSARIFVRALCLDELSAKTIDRLKAIYRPPRYASKLPRKRSAKQLILPEFRRLLLAQLELEELPKAARKAAEDGMRAAAKKRNKRTDDMDYFWWLRQCPYKPGDKIVQVTEESPRRTMVTPPTDIVLKRKWSNGKRHIEFLYFEDPAGRRVRLEILARRIGYGAKKKLQRNGLIRDKIFAEKLLAAFGD